MPEVTYHIIDLNEAKARGLPYEIPWEFADPDYAFGVWRCEDGEPVEFIGEDGGEPEDQMLVRDWKWVASALRDAFELGVRSGGGS